MALIGLADVAGLHQRRMQVQIVRHHGRAQDADGEVEAVCGRAAAASPVNISAADGFGPDNLDAETAGHHGDQREHEGLDGADAEALEPEQQQGIGGGEQDADQQRNVEQQVEPDGRAQDFGQVAGGDGDFAQPPQGEVDAARIGFAAGLGQVAAGDDAEAGAEGLQQDGHGVRHHQDPEQSIAEAGAAFEVGGPVAGIHVADADQIGGSGEGEHAPPEGDLRRSHAGVNVGERSGFGTH